MKLRKYIFPIDPPIDGCSGERMWVIMPLDGTEDVGYLDSIPVLRTDLEGEVSLEGLEMVEEKEIRWGPIGMIE